MADFDAYRKEDDEAILEAYQTLSPDDFQSRAASIGRDRGVPVEEVEARAKFLHKRWRRSQGSVSKANGVSKTNHSSRKTRSSPRNKPTGAAGKLSDASSTDESSSGLTPTEEEFAMLTEEYFFAHPTSRKKLAFWFVELHASEELANAINDKKDSMTEAQWKKSGKLSLFVRKSKKDVFEAFKAEYKRKLHDGYRRPEMEAVLSNLIGGDDGSVAAGGDLSVTFSQDADDEFDETGVLPPDPIDIKPRHERGDKVFAAWIDNIVEEGEVSWFSGTVRGYKVTEKRGHYGEGRTYNIEFDDGDVDQDLKDIFVMSRKDYFLTENGFTSGRRSDIIKVSGVGDEYAETVGWYKTEQTGNQVFALLSDAVKARDEQVVNKKGQYVTEADLLFPNDWDFPEEFASRTPTYTGQAKIEFDDDSIDAEESSQRSSPRRQQYFRTRGPKTDDEESAPRRTSRGNGSVKRSNGGKSQGKHKRRRQDLSEGVMNGHPTTAANTRTYSEKDLLKIDLAVAHRLCAKFGLGALSQTHLSARTSGSECLVCDLPTVWSSVSPENISIASTDIDAIHRGIYNSREDVKAVIHLRSPAATAVSCLEDGFQFLSYDSAPFHKKLAACECRGDAEAVSKNIAAAACSADGCNTILLKGNGFVCFGQSMCDAWILAHRFEECSKVQLEVLKSGGKAREMNDSDFEQAAESGIAQASTPPYNWGYLCESVGL
mmetsp:Transcript_24520/g.53111  ORF Transcript_24520/g.53111 Transcript_24520/m.53111 type:complete len:715 (+) Transcript_24520:230-2374(+)